MLVKVCLKCYNLYYSNFIIEIRCKNLRIAIKYIILSHNNIIFTNFLDILTIFR